jgi:tryptophan synthase alpha chain
MSRIKGAFKNLAGRKEGALVGYLTLGDPDIPTSIKLFKCLSKNVDILEVGIPFSDPIADGPTIQGAMERALKNDVTPDSAFTAVRSLRDGGVQIPIVFMTYYNIVLQYGEEKFIRACREVGVDGLLISDQPVEESEKIVKLCEKNDVDPIFLIAPTTPPERVKRIVASGKGFIYLVSLLGVTGARESVHEKTLGVIKDTLRFTGGLPLVVGFGISKREHVRKIIEAGAQGAVVGSAFVNLVEKLGKDACAELEDLSSDLKKGTYLK